MATKKKRNPTDATMRNVKAARKRTDTLEGRVEMLEELVFTLCEGFANLVQVTTKKKRGAS